MSARAFASGTPWDQSATGSLFGQRVSASLLLRSSRAASGTWTSKGVTAFVAGGSTSSATLSVLARAVSGTTCADKIAAPLLAAAAHRNSRRELRGTGMSLFRLFIVTPARVSPAGSSTKLRETGAQLADKRDRLLECGKVAALRQLIPVNELGIVL